ncbi:unnamed protein product [Didymodactylos carnosus]|uniref:Aminotransferase class V domain-containing protein n=1 Tax=Didymodactylos carnosus TaxID=1234261 RepID=A0A815RZK2_9BILA|nr:unnamed protein product [Didymodactylos carnosus]CAF1492484.1 unnamed protein product [Didymodactylos carnosus]CAF4281608.1 unnamed protein product [Didymodactylos carnosus]CAF4346508.1 unnamed protein product [Didymodactylos carnosus]
MHIKFFIQKTREVIDQSQKNIKLAIIDHISSVPAVIFDIEQIIKFFRSQNILTLIDGAHAIGSIPINLQQMNPDCYLTNSHKWLFSHRSGCLLYVRKELQTLISPITTSFGYKQGYQEEFKWLGTKDYSNYFTISDAIDFRQMIGGDMAIYEYNHQLAVNAGNLLESMWNSSTLTTNDEYIGFMNNVQLPLIINTTESRRNLYNKLIERYNIFLPSFQFDNKYYCRISAQIYLELTDFEYVGNCV